MSTYEVGSSNDVGSSNEVWSSNDVRSTKEVRIELENETMIVAPEGVIDAACIDAVNAALTSLPAVPDLQVIVDVSNGVLQQRAALGRLMEQLGRLVLGGVPVALVCRRLSGRQLLQRVRPSSIPIFSSRGDAMQMQRFAKDGYGPGWSAAHSGGTGSISAA